MPIEIKELHVKINVDEGGKSSAISPLTRNKFKQDIIKSCVEEVMNTIKLKIER